MKNILAKFKINTYTYLFILICILCGYIKNISIIFLICLIHELGHIFFIKLFKYQIIKVELFPFGGYTDIYKKINSNILKDLIISMGGIFSQLILCIFLLLFKNYFSLITYNLWWNYNLTILFFNIIPIIPLDGNKIVHNLLELFLPYHYSYYLNLFLSFIFFILFIYINYKYSYDNYFICGFMIYEMFIYYKDYKYIFNRFLLERSIYNLDYAKIDNHTKKITELKKNVLHYFKKNNKYFKEDKVIQEYLCKKIDKYQDF